MTIIYKEESYAIMGACFEVYKEKGCGFVEQVYQECLEIELEMRGTPFATKQELELKYKGQGHPLKSKYVPDLLCYDKIIVELKAAKELADEHRAQVHNYLKASGCRLGLLINFGHYPKLDYERIAL